MNVQETLTQIDHIMTEVDLVLWQWQTDLDMMSFLGVNATFELWTTDIPPRLVTKDVLAQAAGKELRVMKYHYGNRVQIGTAVIDGNGALAHFTMDKDGNVKQNVPKVNPPFEGANKPVTGIRLNDFHVEDGWVERKIYMKHTFDPDDMVDTVDFIEEHPFFKKEN